MAIAKAIIQEGTLFNAMFGITASGLKTLVRCTFKFIISQS